MESAALQNLRGGLAEVRALQKANPSPQQGGGFTKPQITRAIGRSQVVLLSGHFERYVYAITEELVTHIIAQAPAARQLPTQVRLLHSQGPIDRLARTQWDNRGEQLNAFSEREAVLWQDDGTIQFLEYERLLTWMKTPNCDNLVRAFRIWGIEDIFKAITRTPVHRRRLRMRIGELVEKRNNIAHGDLTVEAQYLDVVQYRAAVRDFCTRADRRMARVASSVTQAPVPW